MADTTLPPPSSARVQILTNPDLLHGIFTFIPFDGDRELARCARVCRSFHEPAIRVLWRNLDALLPLWHLLAPPNTPFPSPYPYDNGAIDGHEDVLAYLEKVSSAQVHLDPIRWDRFLWHARHVRGIRYLSHAWPSVNDATRLLVEVVVEQNGGTTVLPLLRSIEWMGRLSVLGDSALISFFTSTLRHATLQFAGSDEAAIISLLRSLRESSPFLEQIAVDVGFELDAGPSVIQEVLSFPRLCQVQVAQTGPEGFQALVTKSNLGCLDVEEVTQAGAWVGLGHTTSVFDLRDLSIGGDVSVVSGLFDLVRFQYLKNAKVSLSPSAGTQVAPTEVTAFLARFYNAVSTSGLQTLHFALDPGDQTLHAGGDEPNLRDLLAPILRIHDLRFFCLEVRGAIARMDTPDFEALATAWPKLESLSIAEGMVSESRVSLSAVHHLYRHCTRLKELSIFGLSFPIIGVHEIPAPLDRSPVPSHPLQHLAVGGQYILKARIPSLGPDLSDDGAEAVARYLLNLFPNLDGRWYARELDDSSPERRGALPSFMHFDDRWRKVIGRIYSICRARDEL